MNTSRTLRFSLDPATGRLSEEETRRYLSRIGFSIFGLTVSHQVGAVALSALATRFLPEAWLNFSIVSWILSAIALYAIAFPVCYAILKPLPQMDPLEGTFRVRDLFGGLCVAFAMMVLGSSVSQYLVLLIEIFTGSMLSNPVAEATTGTPWYINLIFVGLLAPIMEELLFRRILCRRLLPLGEGYAIVLSSAAFALCHGNLFQFAYAFALGFLFSLVYVKTGRLRYPLFYHLIINLLGGVFAPWLAEHVDFDVLIPLLEEMLASGATDLSPLAPYTLSLLLMTVYDLVLYAGAIIGTILFFRNKRRIILAEGLLPPPKEGRVGNVFLNVGTAAAIAAFAVVFLVSILPAS